MDTDKVFIYRAVEQTKEGLLAAFRLALKEKLHEQDADFQLATEMRSWVKLLMSTKGDAIATRAKSKPIAISFAFDTEDSTKPIGLCMKIGNQFSFYVKPQYRRLGIGSALLELMRGLYGDSRGYAVEGIPESIAFFKKNSLTHQNHTEKKFSIFQHYRLKKLVVMTENC